MLDLSVLQSGFKGDLVTPEHKDYQTSIARWAANASRKAALVAFVKDPSDVVATLKYASANKLSVAICGGGHNASGASSTEGGVVIDLSRYVNGVRIDEGKKLAFVGGGALWKNVDEEAIKLGMATVGGTVNQTGVGGLTLGGGYGWLSAQYGLAIDNLVQATIVTAAADVLTLSSVSHPDLFWAIKGGGSNFGVVTEFVFKLHPQRRTVFAGVVTFSPDQLEVLVEACDKWWTEGVSEKEGLLLFMLRGGPNSQPTIVTNVFYNGSEQEGREKFRWLLDLKPTMDLASEIPYEKLNALRNEHLAPGKNVYMRSIHWAKLDFPSMRRAFDKLISSSAPENTKISEAFPAMLFEFFPLKHVSLASNRKETAMRPSAGFCNVLTWVSWPGAGYPYEVNEEGFRWAQTLAREMGHMLAEGQKNFIPEEENNGYGNYTYATDAQTQYEGMGKDKTRKMFGENYERLREIKKRYDPERVFNKWFAIEPAA